ncbi:lipase family protein [Nocardia vaccinii]|uniref:lipase family protein n=1 Tax=Nocardia vaccinii TaxID=1822 RepID=UPI00082CB65C|nr:lipase family protein [Nocardia vaccinii]
MNTTPEIDSHYAEVVIARDCGPGDVLRARPTTAPGLNHVREARQLVYVSTDSYGEKIPVSGIVLLPEVAPNIPHPPILVYCTSFHGLGGPAPSQLLAAGTEPESHRIDAALARGFIVAVPDGEGMGIAGAGPHTFLAANAAAHTGLDIARATAHLADIKTSTASPVVMWGYADGGRAVIAAAEQHRQYAPELCLRAVAAGAVLADPGSLAAELNETGWAFLVWAAVVGLSHAHQHLPLRHVLTNEGRRIAAAAANLSAAALAEGYRRPLGEFSERPDPWNDPMWRYVLAREKIGLTVPDVPVHLYHGTDDDLVPHAQGHAVYQHYLAAGAKATWREYATDHLGAAIYSIDDALDALSQHLHPPAQPATQTPSVFLRTRQRMNAFLRQHLRMSAARRR